MPLTGLSTAPYPRRRLSPMISLGGPETNLRTAPSRQIC